MTFDQFVAVFSTMTFDQFVAIFSTALGVLIAMTLGGFLLLYRELRRTNSKLDEMLEEWKSQQLALAEAGRARRAEISALINDSKQ
jgi:hypothetical protein